MAGRNPGIDPAVAYPLEHARLHPWHDARLEAPNIAGAWVRWAFTWRATPGPHVIRIRATDDNGHVQPASVPWNDHGCLYNAVIAHPVRIS
jgi:hypothetical protein